MLFYFVSRCKINNNESETGAEHLKNTLNRCRNMPEHTGRADMVVNALASVTAVLTHFHLSAPEL